MAKRLLLKAFSGPHLGAETILADGEYVVGRGPQCDLVFDDLSVADEHVRLKVAGEKVHAAPLANARLLVGGQPTDGCTLPPREYFTIGTTHLAIGFADEPWPLKPLPEIKLGENDAPAAAAPETAPVEPAAAPPRPVRKRRRWLAAGAFAGVLAFFGWGGWLALTPAVRAGAALPDRTGSILAGLIDEHGVADTVKAEKGERGWTIQGHLAHRDVRKALETDCRKALPDSAIRLWDSETLAAASGEVLAAFRVAVAAAPGAPGEVTFRGRVPDAAQWARVRERIRHDVPALETLTDDVLTGAGRVLRDSRGRPVEAASAPPAPPIATPGGGTMVVAIPYPLVLGPSAASNPAPKPEAKPAVKPADAPANAPNVTVVAATPVPSATPAEKPAVPPPALAFQSVSVGAAQWLRLADGTRVSVGGRLGGGYEITAINEDAVEARRGESKIVYRLKEGS